MDISVHPSIVAIRDERVMAAQFEFNDVSMVETELILKSLDPNKATGMIRFLLVSYGMKPQFWLVLLHD